MTFWIAVVSALVGLEVTGGVAEFAAGVAAAGVAAAGVEDVDDCVAEVAGCVTEDVAIDVLLATAATVGLGVGVLVAEVLQADNGMIRAKTKSTVVGNVHRVFSRIPKR
jgi:hypothetical protein